LLKITVRPDQNIEGALRAFRSKMKKMRILEDHCKSLRYEKPSDQKRREKRESKRRMRKANRFAQR